MKFSVLKSGWQMLETLGLGRYESCECADLFRHSNTQTVEEMAKGENDSLISRRL